MKRSTAMTTAEISITPSSDTSSRQRTSPTRLMFTDTRINSISPPPPEAGRWSWFYDTRMPGLALGVSHTGNKTFYFIRKLDGQTRRVAIGRPPVMDVEKARKVALAMNSKAAEGKDPTIKNKDTTTFADLFERYMRDHSRRRNRCADWNEQVYKRYLTNDRYGINLSRLHLHKITRTHVRTVFNGISDHAPIHANRVLALIRSVFNRAIAWDIWSAENPCRGIERNPERSRERFISPFEMPYLFQSLDAEDNDTARDFVYMALLTGARRGNVLSMRWDEIDFEACLWRIGMTKNGTPQTVPLVPEAVAILQARREVIRDQWVFPANSETGHYVEPKKAWKTILDRATGFRIVDKVAESAKWTEQEVERAHTIILARPAYAVRMYSTIAEEQYIAVKPLDMRDIRVHDLRRTMGSWQANMNVSLPIIGRTLNHKSPQSTTVYARLTLDPVRDAMVKATAAMLQHREAA